MGLLKKENKKQAITFRILSVEPKVGGEVGILSKIQATLGHIEDDEETNQFQIDIRIMIRLQKYGLDTLFIPEKLKTFAIEELGIESGGKWRIFWERPREPHIWEHKPNELRAVVCIHEHMENYIKFNVSIEKDEDTAGYITNLAKKGITI